MRPTKLIGNVIVRDVGPGLAKLRAGAGLTLEQLAETSGLDHAHLAAIEQGRDQATVLTLGLIAAALKVSESLLAAKSAPSAGSWEAHFDASVRRKRDDALKSREALIRLNPARLAEIESHQRIAVIGDAIFYRAKPVSVTRLQAYLEAVCASTRKALRRLTDAQRRSYRAAVRASDLNHPSFARNY